jgi:signal transduction histidine kinase/CheY-like chemotaxis protein/sensor domain CHASE-containing protein
MKGAASGAMTESQARRRWWLPWVAVLLGVPASIGVSRLILSAEDQAIRAHLEAHALEHAGAIERQLATDLAVVESLAAVFAVNPEVTRQDFHAVAAYLLARHPSLRALGWDPRIRRAEREAWEAEMRRTGSPGYRITERSAAGAMVPAADRPDYYVVGYIEPYEGNAAALGYDVGSEPRRRAALERAAASGEPALTPAIVLVQDEEEKTGFLAFWPRYRDAARGPSPSWEEDLVGFAVGVFRVEDLVKAATPQPDDQEMGVRVEDVTDPTAPTLLYASPTMPSGDSSRGSGDSGGSRLEPGYLVGVTNFEQGGRTWRLAFAPTARGLAAQRTWFPTATLLAGLFVTGFLSFYLAHLMRRTRQIEELADLRAKEIVHRKRAEEERRRLDAKLQEAQKLESLGMLAGGIAHDFNNLLTGILGNADLALLELSPESPSREELEQIRLAATRAADLTRQMLVYSGKGRFTSEFVDLSVLVGEMAHLLESSISKKAVLRCDFAPDLPTIECDPTQIRQVLMNLITNASDALEGEPGGISIRTGVCALDRQDLLNADADETFPHGPHVFFEVADTGCGMDEATRARIFDPFFSTKFLGRGLGLAAVQGIVHSHGGTIRVDSEPGAGTTTTVLFPCSPGTTVAQEKRPAARVETVEGRGTVLVVDDEEHVRRLLARLVSRLGFSVRMAADGVEAVRVFSAHADEIVAVMLDMTMPRMGGPEAMRAIRAVRPETKVVLSSGYAKEESLKDLDAAGPVVFLQKPFTATDVDEALQRVLSI